MVTCALSVAWVELITISTPRRLPRWSWTRCGATKDGILLLDNEIEQRAGVTKLWHIIDAP
jgi:hypothetical protein